MKKLFGKIGLIFVSLSVLGSTAYAQINAVQNTDTTLKIYGTTESEAKENKIIINILAPGMDYDKLLAADSSAYNDILVYHNQGVTNEKGEFEFTADMTGRKSGIYTVFVTGNKTAVNVLYTDAEKNKDAVEWLSGLDKAPTDEEFKEFQSDLGFYNEYYDESDNDEILNLIYDASKNGRFNFDAEATDIEKRNEAISVFNKMTVINALNTKTAEDVLEYADDMGFNSGETAQFMTLSFTEKENFRKELTKRLSGKEFKTEKEYDDAVIQAFVLSAVKYPDGYTNLTDLLNNFSDELGITKTVTSTTASKISGNDYETASGLAADIKEKANEKPSKGGSSSGGGAGTTKAPDLSIGANVVPKEEIKEYHIDIFTDLEGVQWAREAIIYLAELGIVNGDGNFKFNPQSNVTREEFTKMVVEAFAPEAKEAEISFEDVKASDWFAPYVKKAKGLGIVNGQSETKFGSGEYITRQDMAVIAYNAAKMYGISFGSESKNLFEDEEKISDYAKTAVYSLRADNIINGKGNNEFCPTDHSTRAEAAKMIYGLLEL